MCGIAGLCGYGPSGLAEIEKMKDRMLHRGPDAGGTWSTQNGEVVLGHRRLSILDLSETGAQPMVSHSGRTVLVFNGEIYNYRDLAEMLKKQNGMTFRGTGDSEVLLEAVEAWGLEKTLQAAKGMFAIAIYDRESGVLQLARDRVGEKPLYYGFVQKPQSSFVFASDVGCIRRLSGFDNPINRKVLGIYFTHGYIPAPYSIYEDIFKLEPGTMLTIRAPFTRQELQLHTWWSMEETAKKGQHNLFRGSRKEASLELERLLTESIKGQMISDVPLGAFLSAGIDSSTIVSLMQASGNGRTRTFTIGMAEGGYNEAQEAAAIAKHLGTDHTELYITEQDAKEVIPLLPRMFSEPFADSSQIPTFLVSKLTRQYVTVSLSGDGGDELFCGYNSYRSMERKWSKLSRVPATLRRPAGQIVLHSPLARKDLYRIKGKLLTARSPEEVYRQSYETDPLAARIPLEPQSLPYAYTRLGPDEAGELNHDIMLMDLCMYHPDDILVKVDRTAMAVSLESRVPMLDRDVVEFAWTLPVDYLRDQETGTGKLVLRDVLYRHVPKELMDRPKKGFGIPIAKWLRETELRNWAEELLREDKLRRQGLLNTEAVRSIWEDFIQNGTWRIQIWFILMFQSWYEEEYRRIEVL